MQFFCYSTKKQTPIVVIINHERVSNKHKFVILIFLFVICFSGKREFKEFKFCCFFFFVTFQEGSQHLSSCHVCKLSACLFIFHTIVTVYCQWLQNISTSSGVFSVCFFVTLLLVTCNLYTYFLFSFVFLCRHLRYVLVCM